MSIPQSKFKSDLNGEMILGKFLERFFYSKLNIHNYYRNTTEQNNFLDNQYLGIDVQFLFNGKQGGYMILTN